ncbi:MAG TPA: FAD-dependent oxidoreductase [Miltoncostaeaceae bacterium]|nr:FAD-dependent oxidoreductase [Miltoncostaeaceae bacterium]
MRVAVIGAGIAGLGAAYALRRAHEVEVFERDARPGGHANTVEVDRGDGTLLGLDTGFLVHNRHNYPLLTRLFGDLRVATQDSDMSFGVSCARCRLEYSAVRLWTQPRAVVRPSMARLLAEIVRFMATGRRALGERHARSTLGDYVRIEGYSRSFRDHFVVPFAAALWSTSPDQTLGFPAAYAVRFFDNHGLLGFRRHRWRTVTGGSRRYVDRITAPLGDGLRLGAGVRAILRDADGVTVRTDDDAAHRFDAVVVATHAPQALAMLGDADDLERGILGAFRTTRNSTVLHTDARMLPRSPAARASWNYLVDDCKAPSAEPTVTYYLNKLQALDEPEHYCVTLNRDALIAPERVLRRFEYAHPLYTFASLDAQARLPLLDGRRRTWFAGAYHGFGFHEDGLRSGLGAAAALGAPW